MKSKATIFMFLLLIILAVVAVVVTITKDGKSDERTEIKYAVTSTENVNSRIVIKVLAAVFNGEGVDPFTYVRLIDDSDTPYYPLNGFPKISLNKGDSLEMSFEFNYPSSVDCVLEIKDSGGNTNSFDVSFPELINMPQQNIKD